MKTALITGAAGGIGLGIARACGEAGMQVAIADVDTRQLDAAAAELEAAGIAVLTLALDVRDQAAWNTALERTQARFGPVQLLCNNAGITGSGRRVEQLDANEWQLILDINLGGMFKGVRCLLPHMRGHGLPSHIVNTASMGALLPYPGGASYCASKAAMLAFSDTLWQELQDSTIGVSVLLPGEVRTRLFETSAQHLAPAGGDPLSLRAAQREGLQQRGADPLDIGRRVLAAVRAGEFHIFTHPELRAPAAQRFDAMLAAMSQPTVSSEDIR